VIWLAIICGNDCRYCVQAHTAIAKQAEIADDIVEAMRSARRWPTPNCRHCARFAARPVALGGFVKEHDMQALHDVGYTGQAILDVVVGFSHKILFNYINLLARPPVDTPFAPFEWRKRGNSQPVAR
jgi:AhpD family alkylhydroperoxidase